MFILKNIVLWDMAPCGSGSNRRFGGTYRLHFQGRWITRDRWQTPAYQWSRVIHLPWRWRRYVPPKHRFEPEPHGAISQKTIFFIVIAMKTSNLIWCLFCSYFACVKNKTKKKFKWRTLLKFWFLERGTFKNWVIPKENYKYVFITL
jgi:hypothetical protein